MIAPTAADDGERCCTAAERDVAHEPHAWRWRGRWVVALYRCPGLADPREHGIECVCDDCQEGVHV